MGGILILDCRPSYPSGTMDLAMVEFLFMAQLVRRPLQAIARRWWCRSLYRASRGQRRCPECTKS
ncbi:hypothetical protein [Bradyrhizobium sp. AUGA SZCCT0182]|uniref:hypothetical protein n=1 Tax=Bradyrhizobium sp. AUGA SZCCT0182 TaxID=2807667 RepID=UPI001BABE9C7|nr:hypothetical protein [Bradyrhizobium sp. AUGA SZCCT0182]